MFTSLQDQIKVWIKELQSKFHSGTPDATRRLQYLWAGGLLLVLLTVSYGIVVVFFDKEKGLEEEKKPEPLLIETSTNKVNLDEARYHRLEEDNRKLSEELKALKDVFQESIKDRNEESSPYLQSLEDKIEQLESQLFEKNQFSENIESPFASSHGKEQVDHLTQKHTLNLSEHPKPNQLKTVETTIPAGAFAKTILLSGLDASASMNASADPRPMLLRLVDHGTLPRRFQSDLKDCHCTAGAYGDLSSERIYARLEKLTCIDQRTGEVIETQVAGYIAGSDGKAGMRGVVVSKDGKLLARSLMGGVFAGLSNVANPQNRQAQVNSFSPGGSQVSPPNVGEMFISGMAQGTSTALDRLSQYYIDRAEQLQPVIQADAGQIVDIVFTEGTAFGSSNDQLSVNSHQKNERK